MLGGETDLAKHKLPVTMESELNEELQRMSDDLNISKNQLTLLALYSLVANYKQNGSYIFADLLNPKYKEPRKPDLGGADIIK